MNVKIEHDEENKKFIARLNGREAYLSYRRTKNEELDFYSTYVPPQDRNQGIASAIVKKGLEYARQQELKVIPSCPFVEDFMDENGGFEELMQRT